MLQKILWAYHPGEEHTRALQEKTLEVLTALSAKQPVLIQPVHILPTELIAQEADLQEAFDVWLAGRRLEGMNPLRIVECMNAGVSARADALAHFAAENRFDLVVVATHANEGIDNLLAGSFSESLVSRSAVPIVAVSPSTDPVHTVREVLVPTDFQEDAEAFFEHLLELAKALSAKVVVYHRFEPSLVAAMPVVAPEIPVDPDLVTRSVEEQRRGLIDRSRAWEVLARRHGVSAEFILDDTPGAAAKGILDLAKAHHGGLIALPSRAHPLRRRILGSTARTVLREACCPTVSVCLDKWKVLPEARPA